MILATNEDLTQARRRRPLPPGPVLPRQRDQHRAAAAARAACPTFRCWPSTSWSKSAKSRASKCAAFSDEALAALQRYRWPGNVRELQNVVERAVLLGKGDMIGLEDLPRSVAAGGTGVGRADRHADAQAGPGRPRAADHPGSARKQPAGTATPRPTRWASTARRSTRR